MSLVSLALCFAFGSSNAFATQAYGVEYLYGGLNWGQNVQYSDSFADACAYTNTADNAYEAGLSGVTVTQPATDQSAYPAPALAAGAQFACVSAGGSYTQKSGNQTFGPFAFSFQATWVAFACGASGQPACPPPPACNQSSPTIGETFSGTDNNMATQSYCHAVDHCQVNVKQHMGAGGVVLFTATETNQNCTTGQAPEPSPQTGESCTTTASGLTLCVNPTGGGQCGDLNGQYVCLPETPKGGCQAFADGSKVCDAAAGTPPAPDTGTKGVPATPTQTLSGDQGAGSTASNYSFYNTATVGASSSTGSSSGPMAQVGQNGQTGTTGSSSGSSSGSGGAPNAANGDCGAVGNNCTSQTPGAVSFSGDCADWASCVEGFYTAISSAPIIAGAAAITSAWPGGSCAIGSVSLATLGNRSFDYGSTACNVWTNYIQGPLSAILLVVYGVAGVFIVLSS